MKAIIVDDEPQSIKTLEAKLRMIADDIDIVATFRERRFWRSKTSRPTSFLLTSKCQD
jgi:hypothetical protein